MKNSHRLAAMLRRVVAWLSDKLRGMQLADYLNQTIGMVIPAIHATKIQEVKLLGVEAGGVWIQSQTLTNLALQNIGAATSPKTMVAFVPYHGISVAFSSIEERALNEKAFGI